MHVGVFAVSAALLSLERIAYIWIARSPRSFEAWSARAPIVGGDNPIDAVSGLFTLFKLVQIVVFGWWCWVHGGGALIAPVPHAGATILGGMLVAGGQLLNFRVFQLLGRTGVFYGNRFGAPLPWRTEFPFSVLSHPQYVGTCLSIWGLFLIARFPFPDWYVLPVLETFYYAAGSTLESDY